MKTGKNDHRPDILSISTRHLLSKHFGYQGTIVESDYEKKGAQWARKLRKFQARKTCEIK